MTKPDQSVYGGYTTEGLRPEHVGERVKTKRRKTVDIVFDGPPSHESGRFVEVEDMDGRSLKLGEWIDRGNGLWALRIEAML